MGQDYNPQSQWRGETTTVRQLIKSLMKLDPDAPVIFKTPEYGGFGSNHHYSIVGAEPVSMERREKQYPACETFDEEEGEMVHREAWTEVWLEWSGVVIT